MPRRPPDSIVGQGQLSLSHREDIIVSSITKNKDLQGISLPGFDAVA